MISHNVKYEDFDGNQVEETLWFHIYKTDLAGNLHLVEEIERIQKLLTGPTRELTLTEVKTMIDLVKTFVRLSYGVRLDEKRFRKNEEVWQDFQDTASYDAFMMDLFENPQKAMDFMVGVIPPDLREKAMAELTPEQKQQINVPQAPEVKPEPKQTKELSMEELMAEMRRRQEEQGATSGG